MSIRVSEELDKKYKQACNLCLKRHELIYGNKSFVCAFRHFDNEYCSDIETAERLNKERRD